MAWNDGIEPGTPTYRIAADEGHRIRVLAGPGTGKSFAIKRRVTRLLEQGVPPASILAVTFTRMSAADLVRDIRSLEVKGAADVVARTLHSECFRILAHNDVIVITGRHPRPLAAFELEPMLEDLRSAAPGQNKRAIRKLVSSYEAAWARLQHEEPGYAPTPEDQVFEDAAIAWLQFHRGMLIGELVPFAYRYLRDNPAAPERRAYGHVLVDEYQDLNKAEQELAVQLASGGHLAIVGDDDQSIYTFKNAHRLGIIEFPTIHQGTTDHTMDLCQRCPALVVSMANSLIGRNRSRPTPVRTLRAKPENGQGVVEVFHFRRHAKEIDYLARRVEQFIEEGVPAGQIIVLCQARKYIRPLYDRLRAKGVPAEFCYQESQLDDEAATERLALLTLAGNREDRVGLRYLVGFGSNDWRTGQWARIRALSETEGLSPWEILSELATGTRLEPRCRHVTDRFREIQTEIEALNGLTGAALRDAWLPEPEKYTELQTLTNAVVQGNAECDAAALAEEIREVVVEPEVPDHVEDVRIMSLHKSKGLSANVVIIAGCVEGVLPRMPDRSLSDAQRNETVEEYRRLFFVGITRVKAVPASGRLGHLILSSSQLVPMAIAKQSLIAGQSRVGGNVTTVTSRFMRDLGRDCPAPVADP